MSYGVWMPHLGFALSHTRFFASRLGTEKGQVSCQFPQIVESEPYKTFTSQLPTLVPTLLHDSTTKANPISGALLSQNWGPQKRVRIDFGMDGFEFANASNSALP